MVGKNLSHYRIEAELGRGGMGIVFKARDMKLDRDVAIKVLPASALASEDDRARFYREAKAAAALNHPHIAQIYQIDEAVPEGGAAEEPRPFIAMEFIEGGTLEDRIKAGPLKLEEAVRFGTQVADALRSAHAKEIVHRDIKSANIMLSADGKAKVLDFGLAQTAESTKLTRMGSTLGTIAYMSPEQARGEEVDSRTDLYSLGAVLYEAVSGTLPFGGEYEQAVVFSILNSDPEPLTALRTGVPMALEQIVGKLLRKDREHRYQTAADVIADLKVLDLKTSAQTTRLSTPSAAPVAPAESISGSSGTTYNKPSIAIGAVAGMLLVALMAFFAWPAATVPSVSGSTKRFQVPVDVSFGIGAIAISEQGDRVAIASDVIRLLDLSTGATSIFRVPRPPVQIDFSPSGRNLLLTMSDAHMRLDLETGTTVELGSTTEGGPRGTWMSENAFVYEDRQTIYSKDLTTNLTRMVARLDSAARNERDADSPFMLPGGEVLMATLEYWDGRTEIGFWDIESAELRSTIDVPGRRPQFVPPGYLIYIDGDRLMGMPFDPNELRQAGPISSIESPVKFEGMSVSDDGTLVHVGKNLGARSETLLRTLSVVRKVGSSMDSELAESFFVAAGYRHASLDPAGRLIAIAVYDEDEDAIEPASDIWILDLETGSRRPYTRGGISDYPAWNARGDSLYFVEKGVNDRLVVAPLSNAAQSRLIWDSDGPLLVDLAVSPDGRWAAVASGGDGTIDAQSIAHMIDLQSGREMTFESIAGNALQFDFSPDSRYLAYQDQGGIYVMEVERPALNATMVWENSALQPRWSPLGDYLYALSLEGDGAGNGQAVQVSLDPVFSSRGSVEIEYLLLSTALDPIFEVFPDGSRFLSFTPAFDPNQPVDDSSDTPMSTVDMTVIVNIQDLLNN